MFLDNSSRYIKRGRSRRLPVEESSPIEEEDLSLSWAKWYLAHRWLWQTEALWVSHTWGHRWLQLENIMAWGYQVQQLTRQHCHLLLKYLSKELKGCPRQLITDLGTESGLAALMQSYFHDDADAHSYISSPRNRRIEGWWSFYSWSRSTWWRNFFQDLELEGVLYSSSELSMECLWNCFAPVIQNNPDIVKEHRNSHRIRKSRHQIVPGRLIHYSICLSFMGLLKTFC